MFFSLTLFLDYAHASMNNGHVIQRFWGKMPDLEMTRV